MRAGAPEVSIGRTVVVIDGDDPPDASCGGAPLVLVIPFLRVRACSASRRPVIRLDLLGQFVGELPPVRAAENDGGLRLIRLSGNERG